LLAFGHRKLQPTQPLVLVGLLLLGLLLSFRGNGLMLILMRGWFVSILCPIRLFRAMARQFGVRVNGLPVGGLRSLNCFGLRFMAGRLGCLLG
jgi:hypothetical protein